VGLYDVWLDFQEKCLTSQKFHDFAIKFPLTRPIVRKRQSELFDIVSGFVYSQILYSCVELGIITNPKLKKPGASLQEVSDLAGLQLDETRRLMDGAVSLRLFEKRHDKYRLGDLGAALSINKGVLAMIGHHGEFYKDLVEPVDLLKSGRRETNLSRYWDYARSEAPAAVDAKKVTAYSELMSQSQLMVADEVLASFNFSPYKTLLDVGGGQGTFLTCVANTYPDLQLKLFDLPEVAKRAEQNFADNSLSTRANCYGGSFFDDALPQGADLISLVRILHDHDDKPVMKILKAVHQALEPGGALIVCEPMSTGDSAHRISDAYFNFYLYAMGSGRPRSPEVLQNMLKQAGFSSIHTKNTRAPLITSILLAQK
jgi:demethylspheroidene O-methyltransferase